MQACHKISFSRGAQHFEIEARHLDGKIDFIGYCDGVPLIVAPERFLACRLLLGAPKPLAKVA